MYMYIPWKYPYPRITVVASALDRTSLTPYYVTSKSWQLLLFPFNKFKKDTLILDKGVDSIDG